VARVNREAAVAKALRLEHTGALEACRLEANAHVAAQLEIASHARNAMTSATALEHAGELDRLRTELAELRNARQIQDARLLRKHALLSAELAEQHTELAAAAEHASESEAALLALRSEHLPLQRRVLSLEAQLASLGASAPPPARRGGFHSRPLE
jgi:hypothetical protein